MAQILVGALLSVAASPSPERGDDPSVAGGVLTIVGIAMPGPGRPGPVDGLEARRPRILRAPVGCLRFAGKGPGTRDLNFRPLGHSVSPAGQFWNAGTHAAPIGWRADPRSAVLFAVPDAV